MARMSAVLLIAAAVSSAHSQYLGVPYATTATSFALPFIGGFQYAPAIAPVGPVVKAAAPFAAYPYAYGAPFAHPIAPVVKAGFPLAYAAPAVLKTVVKTAVPAIPAPVVKAVPALPFAPGFAGPIPAPGYAAGPFPAPAVAGPFPAPAIAGPFPAPGYSAGPFPGPAPVGPVSGPVPPPLL